jgi:unsaturated rhamnogalacturonyl hydrolase
MKSPLDTVKRIGDKLVRDTPFEYRLELAVPKSRLDCMHCVDFGRTFGLGRPAVAYALTRLNAPSEMTMRLQIEHNDGCRIWLNGEVVYESCGDHYLNLRFEERSLVMSHECELHLRKGANTLLVKSETRGKEWKVYFQPPATHGAVVAKDIAYPEIGLRGIERIGTDVAVVSNWLVVGPFSNTECGGVRTGLNAEHGPGWQFDIGRMYQGLDGPVTWTIPKVDVIGAMIDPLPWGTNYHWNYHNGGVAWAMQALTELSGEPCYANFAVRFCDFHLDGVPFVEHQVKTLNAVDSANHFIIDTPLLDFTLAPSLPFLQRLRDEEGFSGRGRYEEWIARMIRYAREEQVRLPGIGIYTRTTPIPYTTWVDDMFMGIPFLIQAALYVADPVLRQELFDDATRQALGFSSQVWDPEMRLYMHARYFGNPAKLPYWARCNGWAVWAMSEVLLHLPESHQDYGAVLTHFQCHCESLVKYQNDSGLWPNVLNRPDSPLEVSGTAIFVMCMARGVFNGWLDETVFLPVVERAWQALDQEVGPDGTVHRICMGTMCTEDVEYYVSRPFYDNDTHGLFAVLFAGIEMQRLLDAKTLFVPKTESLASVG